MTTTQMLITVLLLTVATVLTRSLPFLIFSGKKNPPRVIQYLGKALPPAVFALLLVYCLKNISPLTYPYAIPEIIALCMVALIHLLKRNMLLSIASGTVIYMLLVQLVF